VDSLGRSTGLERPRLEAGEFVVTACRALGVETSRIGARTKDREMTRARELIAAVGIERWGQRAGELGAVLGRHPDVVSRWARMAALRRGEDASVAEDHDRLDRTIAEAVTVARGL
jgi:hypothetical protein